MSSPLEPIAIIGTACRFPGGSDSPSKLWELLREPRDVMQEIPAKRRWKPEAFFHEDPEHRGTSNVQSSYFLDNDPADLDNNFFNIQPAEAEAIDPQQRMLMEVVYEALCDGGQSIEALRGSPTSVIVGVMADDWSSALYRDAELLPQYAATGVARSILSNRLSYFYDWHGESITLDTACSSSLVAVHLGIQAIRNGESRVAVAAGTNLILTPFIYMAESNLHMLSTSGRSRMWDRDVDGYGRGEGVATVIMKSLNAALEDKDPIQCIIRATGLNQDGKTPGVTMPNPIAQANLIRETYTRAGLDIDKPEHRPQFFHAHGTGTPAGDPREAEAISRAFYSNGAEDKIYVGSIKSVFGHTEGAAGLASLIGSMLAVQHGIIPPNMHFEHLNPKVAPFYDHLEVPTKAKPWPDLLPGQPRRASVNSFGFGGTNAHAIIESYEPASLKVASNGPLFSPLTVSAASDRSLRELLSSLSAYLKANVHVSLRDFAYTLQERMSTLAHRLAISASTVEGAIQKMDELLSNGSDDFCTKHFGVSNPRVLGVFTGQGAQWPRMGAELIEMSPFAAKRLDELDAVLLALPSEHRPQWTLKQQLLADAKASKVYQAAFSQPLCTAVQILLVDLLRLANVRFHAVVGHSSGEIAAAYATGFLSARSAITIAYYRGYYSKLAASPNGAKVKGAMMAVGTSFEDASELCELEEFQGRLQIAAQNSPSSITLTGDEDAVDAAEEILKDEGKFARKLKVDTAYHSAHMLPCASPYLASITAAGGLRGSVPTEDSSQPKWYSSVHRGKVMTAADVDAQYWVDNLTSPVLFSPAVADAIRESGSFDVALEIGPHPALKGPCLETLKEASGDPIPVPYSGVLSRGKADTIEFSNALGLVWATLGAGSVSFERFEKAVSGQANGRQMLTKLPKYPWDYSRKFWQLSRLSGSHINTQDGPHPLLGRRCIDRETSDKIQWRNILRPKDIEWLKGHQLQGQIVLPAAGYMSMAVEAITAVASVSNMCLIQIEDFVIQRAIPFVDDNFVIECLFALDVERRTSEIMCCKFSLYCGNPFDGSSPLTLHGSGKVSATFGRPHADALPCIVAEEEEGFNLYPIDSKRFYNQFEQVGYQYSPPFNGLRSIKRREGFAVGTLEDMTEADWADNLLIHPALLDTVIQAPFATAFCPGDGSFWSLYVPTRIGSVSINPYFASRDPAVRKGTIYSWESILENRETEPTSDTTLFCKDKTHAFIQIHGLNTANVSPGTKDNDLPLFSHIQFGVDRPDGRAAAVDDPPLELGQDAIEADRLALFYLRRLTEIITPQEREQTLPHYKHVLNWASHVVEVVKKGENPRLPPSCLEDAKDRFKAYLAKYADRVDTRLLRSVGEHLPEVIRSGSSILEHMTKDGMLDRIYAEGLGLEQPNRYMARIIAQVGHRYPRMHLFEIGAGTGGSTRYILPMLGDSFGTYTYTDVSSGFFEAAQERFREFEDRMIYKTYDMEQPPTSQGFVEGSYDVVLASHVLHATDKLEDMMKGIRALLKPGGYIIVQEIITNEMLHISLPMSGLPGWWVGAENGRPWGPALELSQWDSLLRRCGFSGIDTTSMHGKFFAAQNFVAQAVDERVKLLRSPLSSISALPPAPAPQLTIVGGKSTATNQLADEIASHLAPRYQKIARVRSFQDLAVESVRQSTVMLLSELDGPLLASPTHEKHETLQMLWREGATILWVSRGARADLPQSSMTVGLGRCAHYEYGNLTLERLDLDGLEPNASRMLAEELLTLECLGVWTKNVDGQGLLWSIEPEVYVESGVRTIPRLRGSEDANMRYNTSRRTITKEVDPRNSPLVISGPGNGSHYEVQYASPLRLPTPPPFPGKTRTMCITHFLMQCIDVGSSGRLMLCVGIDQANGEKLLALSHAAESPVPILASWTRTLGSVDPVKTLATVAASILATNMLRTVPKGGSLLVHEPDSELASALVKHAQYQAVPVIITTSSKTHTGRGWQYIHGQLSHRQIRRHLPTTPFAFFDLSPTSDSVSIEAGQRISECIPENCSTYNLKNLLGSKAEPQLGVSADQVSDLLHTAWLTARNDNGSLDETSVPVIPLSDISKHNVLGEHLAVVDCSCPSAVTAVVQPIDSGIIFRADRTYCLFGLANEVGQSLCQWMVKHGARHVVMTSRRPKVGSKFVRFMERLGVDIRVLPCDITIRESVRNCHQEICQTMPCIAGVVNGAMVLRDGLFQNMAFEDLMTVLDPKVKGTQILDELFYNTPLDFFIVTSSLTSVVGNSGQTNYAVANVFMVALMAQRKKRGLAGSAISMTSLIGLGFVERSDELDEEYFYKVGGHRNMSEADLHRQFAEAILIGRPEHSNIYAEIASGLVPIYGDDKVVKGRWREDIRFNHFVLERTGSKTYAGQAADMPLRVKLAAATKVEEASAMIKESFLAKLRRIMMISDEDDINERASLIEQGIDSIMAVEIRTWFLKEVEVDIPVLKIISGESIQDLLTYAFENMPKAIVDLEHLETGGKAKPALERLDNAPRLAATNQSPSPKPQASLSSSSKSNSSSSPAFSDKDYTPPQTPPETPATPVDDPLRAVHPAKAEAKELMSRMSFGQERFWFLNGYLEDRKTFNMVAMLKLEGKLDLTRMEQAVQIVVQRHEVLRTRFLWSDGQTDERVGMQAVLSEPLALAPVHLATKRIASEAEAEAELHRMHKHDWDLSSWEAVKISLLSVSDDVHYLMCGAHHISLDGYSFSLLFVDLECAYSGRALTPVGPESQPRSFADSERDRYTAGAMKSAIEHYRGVISSDLKPIDLFPFAKSQTRPVLDYYGHFEAKARLEPPLVSKLKQIARKNRSTSFHLYLAALQALIFRLVPDMDDFFIGVADANRMDKKYMFSLGFFLNLLPLHFTRTRTTISNAISATRDKAYEALRHSGMPFDLLLQELQIPRSNTHTPIFQVFVDYRQIHQDRAQWGGCKLSEEKWYNARTGYDVALEITDNPTGESLLSLRLQEGLYSQRSTELLMRSYVNVLETIAQDADARIDELPCWHPADIEKAFQAAKGPEIKLEWPCTVSHRVDEMVEKHSSKPALKDGLGHSLTYAELGARVDTIARALVDAAVPPGAFVAVFQEPSADWICSMLAIFRVGAVYVPLDLRNSIARLFGIVKSAQPMLVLTDNDTTTKTKLVGAEQCLEVNVSQLSTSHLPSRMPNKAQPGSPAVVLFTSGSTGEPKGVIMKHSNLAAECEAYSRFCDLPSGNAVVMQQSIFSFDFSIEQTFVALADGGCLYVVPADKRGDPNEIAALMVEQGVTYTSGTPSEYEMLLKHASEMLAMCKTWRFAFGGGEYLSPSLIREFAKLPLPNLRLFNNYGPAEVTTAALKGEIRYREPSQIEEHTIAGFVLPNYQLYFADSELQPVPIGVPGEILVGGPGVTAGYLNMDEMTRRHYIPAGFDPTSGSGKLYRTGDRGHLREDGAVYWDSRIEGDTQVKLRGFRVELTEVEAVLVKHAGGALSRAVVTLKGKGASENVFLAAHVLFTPDFPRERRQDLIKMLQRTLPLPSYMRPSVIVALAEMPLTAHSKIDRRAIRALPLSGEPPRKSSEGNASTMRLSQSQRKVAGLWRAVIPHERLFQEEDLTPETDFFHVGGNSLLLVTLQTLVKRTLGSAPRLMDLMNASSLGEMSDAIEASTSASGTINWEVETRLPEALQRLMSSTTKAVPQPRPTATSKKVTVVLAGATGYLGRHVLPRLLATPQVREVICLVRDGSPSTLPEQAATRAASVKTVTVDLSQPSLGLSEAAFNELAHSADVVVDCAANRAFWDGYEALRPVNLSAVKDLARLAARRAIVDGAPASVHFLSSGAVSVYGGEPPVDGSDGYVASKWAAERFLHRACSEGLGACGVAVTIHRPVGVGDHVGESPRASETLDANEAAAEALAALREVTRSIGKRPDLGALAGGYLDLTPVDEVVRDLVAAVVDGLDEHSSKGEVRLVTHTARRRVALDDFARLVGTNSGLEALPSMSALEWFGEVKKGGFDQLVTSQRLVMRAEGGELVSRR